MSMDPWSNARKREVRCAPCPREPTLVRDEKDTSHVTAARQNMYHQRCMNKVEGT